MLWIEKPWAPFGLNSNCMPFYKGLIGLFRCSRWSLYLHFLDTWDPQNAPFQVTAWGPAWVSSLSPRTDWATRRAVHGGVVWMAFGHLQGPLSCRVKLRIENGKLDQRPAFVLPRPPVFKVACQGTSPEVPKEGATTSSLSSVFHWRILHFLHKEASAYGWKREGTGDKPLMQLRVTEHGVT